MSSATTRLATHRCAERSQEQRRRNLEHVARFIEENSAAAGLQLKLPAETAARILLSTSDGFANASQFDAGQVELYATFLDLIIPALFEPADESGTE